MFHIMEIVLLPSWYVYFGFISLTGPHSHSFPFLSVVKVAFSLLLLQGSIGDSGPPDRVPRFH